METELTVPSSEGTNKEEIRKIRLTLLSRETGKQQISNG